VNRGEKSFSRSGSVWRRFSEGRIAFRLAKRRLIQSSGRPLLSGQAAASSLGNRSAWSRQFPDADRSVDRRRFGHRLTHSGFEPCGCDESEDVSPSLCDNSLDISFKRVIEAVMCFSHPLARKAKVWPMKTREGSDRNVLVIVTSLVLDPQSEKYKKKLVDRLSKEASAYVAGNAGITDFVLINRIKEWE
jgi:hypothetical protein